MWYGVDGAAGREQGVADQVPPRVGRRRALAFGIAPGRLEELAREACDARRAHEEERTRRIAELRDREIGRAHV